MADRFRDLARRLDRSLLPVMGPAQIGIGHAEEPEQPPVDAACPLCRRPMAEHDVQRSTDPARATRLICPRG